MFIGMLQHRLNITYWNVTAPIKQCILKCDSAYHWNVTALIKYRPLECDSADYITPIGTLTAPIKRSLLGYDSVN